jgi:outer membrane protein TolC
MKLISLNQIVAALLFISFSIAGPLFAETSISIPELLPGEELTLAQAIKLAEERNLSLKAAKTDIAAAEAQLNSAWTMLLPNLYGVANYTYLDHTDSTIINGVEIDTNTQETLTAGLQASMPIFNAQAWTGIGMARKSRDLTNLSVEQMRQTLLYMVASSFYQALSLRALIGVYKNRIDTTAKHLAIAKVKHRSGVGDRVNVTRTKTDLLSSQEALIEAHRSLNNARDALAVLLGLDGLPMPVESQAPTVTIDTESRNWLTTALEKRLDTSIATAQVQLSEKRYTTSKLQFLPSLMASWNYNYRISDPAPAQSDERDRWQLGLSLTMPIFDFTFFPDLSQNSAALSKAKYQAEDTRRNAELQLRRIKRELEQATLLEVTARKKSDIARETLMLTETDFRTGTGSSLAVADARRGLIAAEVNWEIKKLDLILVRLKLAEATGLKANDVLHQ